MKNFSKLKASVAPAALGLAMVAQSAFAQEATTPQSSDDAAPQQQIIVTGSRIANPNLTAISPVTVVGATEVKNQGTTRVEDLLNSLPQVFASEGSSDANGASGIATVDLRNLGVTRTLVLVNGRRLGPGDPTVIAADLNFIPAALIQRVDILTGGASATYGSDALAGVVNFVLNKDFEGVQLDGQYSFYNHNNDYNKSEYLDALAARNYQPPRGMTTDGAAKTVNLTVGAGFDDGRGHVTAYAGWRRVNAVTQGDRDYSYCGYSAGNSSGSNYYTCGGSSTSANGRFRRTTNSALGSTPVYRPTGTSYTVNPNAPGTFRTFSSARDGFNFNPYNYFQRPDERYTLGAFAHYQINDSFDPYLEVMFMDDHTRAQIAPSGAFYGTDFFVNCNNPLLSASQQTALCAGNAGTNTLQSLYIGRRNVEGGGRVDDLRHTDYRIVAGTKGQITEGITYDVYGQFWRAILAERYENDFSRAKINRALNVVTDPTTGNAVCAAAIPNAQGQVIDANCVPWNIFSPGGVTQAAVDYLQTPGFQTGETTEYVASGNVSIDLGTWGVKAPWADDSVQLALGAEYRKEKLELTHDIEFLTGDLAGQGTPFGVKDTKGSFSVKEIYGEIAIPLVTGKPGFDTLAFTGGYRYSDYSLSGSVSAYKAQLEWAPVKELRLRAGYNRAVRAPNTLELFNEANVVLWSGQDPCAGAAPSATAAQCALTGVTAADYGTIDSNPANQYNQQTSGNRGLRPEKGDTYTLGFVFTPKSNISLSVDAYDIRIKDQISTLGARFIIDQCIATGLDYFCSKINRAPGGSLFTGTGYVANPTLNLGSVKTRGIDVNGSARFEIGGGSSVALSLVGTYLDSYKIRAGQGVSDVGEYDCAGYFGANSCGTPLPKWRHTARVTYTTASGVSVSAAWRFFLHTKNELLSSQPLLNGGATEADVNPSVRGLPDVSYFDLSLSARVGKNYTFRIGAQNLFDRTPPVLDSNYTTNGSGVYAQVYDSLGRYIYAAVQLAF
ncbi:TonB-dependent receptor domain-containing protein [Novosphingobium olei]|uniref:TonB-dependent receptor n=1 Tax=Novosphingobium olei TaxID=2728851 RepID=A0A7Y0GAX4_9SPHN|nr:TonB-dependent receptor [Novosphingobium olei]NML94568.1 TonB-dependent receptor [Novosphingobium olei]